MDVDYRKMADRLRSLRKSRALTMREVSDAAQVSFPLICKYEHLDREYSREFKNGPTLNTLLKIADLYGVSLDYILGRTDKCSMSDVCSVKPIVFWNQHSRKSIEVWPYNLFETLKVNRFDVDETTFPPITNNKEEAILGQVLKRFLTDKYFEVVLLYFKDGLTQAEIAHKLGITKQRVSKILLSSCKKLASKYFMRDLKLALYEDVYVKLILDYLKEGD